MAGTRRWRRTALLACALVLGPALAALTATPAEAASSWKTVRTEEFSGSSLPKGCESYSGKYAGGASTWKRDDVDVKGGLLKLKLEKRKSGKNAYTSGGVGCWGWAQKYGRYEVRAKIPAGKGIDSYITLVPAKPKKSETNAWTGIELLAPGTETAYITNGYGKQAETAHVDGSYSDEFHTYVVEWAPKHLRVLVDKKEVFYSQQAYKGSRWFGLVMSNGDQLTGVPDATTKLPATFQIDRVKVSSYTGHPPKVTAADKALLASAAPSTEGPAKAPATTPAPTALTAQTGDSPALAGGMWPWLLGGSVIAGSAMLLLSYPGRRDRGRRPASRAPQRPPAPQRTQVRTSAPPAPSRPAPGRGRQPSPGGPRPGPRPPADRRPPAERPRRDQPAPPTRAIQQPSNPLFTDRS
ncbi:family 16 glycosylhydrolase [Spongisporangium articulatum]|uniref:Family 16 glycosylhydrolase n=1 Tax=Spongisporangium articulatum TaxID=3362603 RepID=A0ABW8AIP2_9ACTN